MGFQATIPDGHDAVHVPIEASSAVEAVVKEVARQDAIHPDGFPATRDGLRLGFAAMLDELDEAKDAWRSDRRSDDVCPWLRIGDDLHTEGELIQAVAIGLRMLRSIHEAAGPARGEW